MRDAEVLVVGAGPVGLSAAVALRRHGVSCRVIDQGGGITRESRALGVHARTMEAFEQWGILDGALEAGLRMRAGRVRFPGGGEVSLSFDELEAPHPFLLVLPQSETERLLAERLESMGGEIEWDTELVGLSQDGASVTVSCEGPGGEERTAHGWVLGCDGAHSGVRHALGLGFAGTSHPEDFLLADVQMEGSLPRDELGAWLTEAGLLFAAPLPGEETWRIILDRPQKEEPSLEELREMVGERVPEAGRIREIGWMSHFRVHCRVVERMREGRVFLLGDAAHIHSPVGGQGMNIGIHDAWNLAWKLALVVKDVAPEAVLDSYDHERRPVARAVARATDLALEGVLLKNPLLRAMRDRLAPLFGSFAPIQRRLVREMAGLDTSYGDSPLVGEDVRGPGRWNAPAPGERAPDARVRVGEEERRLFELFVEPLHHVLLLPARGEDPAGLSAIARSMEEAYPGLVRCWRVKPAPTVASGEEDLLVDHRGELTERYGIGEVGGLVLIRPDGHVGFRARPRRLRGVESYFRRIAVAAEG